MRRLRSLAAALLLSTSLTIGTVSEARAEPVTTAIGAIAAFAASGPIAGAVVQFGLAMAFNAGAQLVKNIMGGNGGDKPRLPSAIRTSVAVGGVVPQSFVMGNWPTAGSLAYRGSWGSVEGAPNGYYVEERILSDLPIRELTGFLVGGQRCTIRWDLPATAQGYPVGQFRRGGVDHMWVRFYDGTQTVADAYMRDKFGAHPNYPYTADMVGPGQAGVIVTRRLPNEDNRDLFSGNLEYLFETSGIDLYNVVKDSTAGGSGTHRRDDPSTWEPSSNLMVQAYNVLAGIYYDDQWLYGLQDTHPSRLPASAWIAAINECARLVDKADGTQEPQFAGGVEVTVDSKPADVLEELLAGCSGRMAEIGGIYKPLVGAPGAAVFSFTDADIVVTTPESLEPFPRIEETYNGVQAKYPERAAAWDLKDAPTRYSPEAEAEDGGRQLLADLTFGTVSSVTQVQRLMKAAAEDQRRWLTHGLTLPPIASELEPLDVVSWTSAARQYDDKAFLITEIEDEPTYLTDVIIQETDPADYDYDAGTDEKPSAVADISTTKPPAQVIIGFGVEPAVLPDDQGNPRRPAVKFTWNGEVEDVRSVSLKLYTADNQVLVFSESTEDVTAGEATVAAAGILPAQALEGWGRYNARGPRQTEWTGPYPVITKNIQLTGWDLAPGSIFLTNLTEQVQNAVNDVIFDRPGSVASQIDALRDLFEQAMASMSDLAVSNDRRVQKIEQKLGSALASIEHIEQVQVSDKDASAASLDIVTAQFGNSIAAISQLMTTMASDIAAHSTSIFQISAQVGDATGNGLLKWDVMADAVNGAAASVQLMIRASNASGYGAAGLIANVYEDLSSEVITVADTWIVTNGGLTSFAKAMKWTGGELLVDELKVRLITSPDGTSMVLNAEAPELTFIGGA